MFASRKIRTMALVAAVLSCCSADACTTCREREAANLLARAEALCAVASALGCTRPTGGFGGSEGGAESLASADSHGVPFERLAAQWESAANGAMAFLASKVSTKGVGIPILVFNPCSWTRTDAVSVTSPFPGESVNVKVTDPSGRVRAARAIGDSLQFTARDVPALGYKVFWVNRAAEPVPNAVRAEGAALENEFYRVTLDSELCAITGIYDKKRSREVVPVGKRFGALQVVRRRPLPGSEPAREEAVVAEHIGGPTDVIVINSGPARATLNMDCEYGASQFVHEVTLYDGVPRIDLRITADWRQDANDGARTSALNVAFETDIEDGAACFDAPLGAIRLPADGREVRAFNWADLSGNDRGVSILNDCAHALSVDGSMIRAVLLGASQTPGRNPTGEIHEFLLSIYPHQGDWRRAETVRRGIELSQPLVARVIPAQTGDLPPSRSFVSVSEPNVVAALKPAGNDSALILSLEETHGTACTVRVRLNMPAARFVRIDALGHPVGAIRPVVDGVISLEIASHDEVAVKLLRE